MVNSTYVKCSGDVMRFLLAIVVAGASCASADLYVSPHKGADIEYVQPSRVGDAMSSSPSKSERAVAAGADKAQEQGARRQAEVHTNAMATSRQRPSGHESRNIYSTRHGQVVPRGEPTQVEPSDYATGGEKVFLSDAMEMMFPGDAWKVAYDENLSPSRRITWSSVPGERTVDAIARQNGIYFAVNEAELAVGVSVDKKVAESLAYRENKVWYVHAPSTLKTTVERWASKAGYAGVDWQPTQDYEVLYPATITGDLADAMNVLLRSVAGERLPLQAEVTPNKVIQIKRGGWKAP